MTKYNTSLSNPCISFYLWDIIHLSQKNFVALRWIKRNQSRFKLNFPEISHFWVTSSFVRRRVVRPRFPQNNLFLFAFALLCFMSHVQITLDKWNSNVSDYSKTVWFDSQVAFHVSEKRRLVSFFIQKNLCNFSFNAR